nr:extracellular solute-binding protein [Mobilicoccus caccae]
MPVIRGFEPGFEIGVFPYPVAKNADEQVLTSGVDVTLTMVKDAPHPQESMKFIEFLMREDNVEAFTKAQSAVPTLEGVEPSEKALVDLMPYYENDRLIGFIDLHIPPSVGLEPYLHQARIDGDTEGFLTTLDQEWDKVAERRSPRRQ